MKNVVDPILWKNEKLVLLDQRLLPHREVFLEYSDLEGTHKAIKEMVTRGAPLIGFTAIFGMALWAKNNSNVSYEEAVKAATYLKTARPTAVNLAYEVDRCLEIIKKFRRDSYEKLVSFGYEQIEKCGQDCLLMAKAAEKELVTTIGDRPYCLMTHCNAGYLAVGKWGTAMGVVHYLHQQKKVKHVFADETRPYLQGSRLTAFELAKGNIPHDVVVEGAASYIMGNKQVDAIFVGADRIAGNGDAANKIGTCNLAIIAQYFKIPFYVVAPTSTFDLSLTDGSQIEIEMRPPEEVLGFRDTRVAPQESTAINPSFDVTPAHLITGIICEKGIITDIQNEKVKSIVLS